MLRTQENITNVIIAKDISRAISAGTVASPTSLADGEVVVTDMSLRVLTSTQASTADKIFIVQGRGTSKPIKKYLVKKSDIIGYTGTRYTAAVEQVSYVGFNGTSGTIDVISDNSYILRFDRKVNHFVRGNQHWYKYGLFVSDSSATVNEITDGLTLNFVANIFEDRKLEDFLKVERVCSDTTNDVAVSNNATVTKGSKYVTFAGNETIAAGDYVRIGGTTATSPMYKVATGVTAGTQIVLDQPYEGTSATVLAANFLVLSAANAAAASWGIKFTGMPYKFDVYRWGDYEKVRFKLGIENFGATTITYATGASEGVGVYEEVALNESMSWANDGQTMIIQVPPLTREADVVSGEEYSPVSLVQNVEIHNLTSAGDLRSEILIYCAVNTVGSPHTFGTNIRNANPATTSGTNTSLLNVLDAFKASAVAVSVANDID